MSELWRFLVALFTVVLPPMILVLGVVYIVAVLIILALKKSHDIIKSLIPQRMNDVRGGHLSGIFERK